MCSSAQNARGGHSKSESTSENNHNDSALNHDKDLANLGLSPIDKKKMLKNIMEFNEIQKGAEQVIGNDFLIMANQFTVSQLERQLVDC